MRRTLRCKPIVVLLLVSLAILICIPVARGQSADVAVIVHPANPVSNLSMADLRRIFIGDRHAWPGGNPIKVFFRPAGSHEQLVLLKLVGMSDSEYKRYWTAQVFRGEAEHEPQTLTSVGIALEATRTFPGAITLIQTRDSRPSTYIKVVRVEGRLPGEPGYPLH